MAQRILNRSDGTPLWWMELDHDATVELFSYFAQEKAYGLLHENGSLMYDSNGRIVAPDWPTACRLAQMNSTNWIVMYHDQRIVRVVFTKQGAYVEGSVVIQPCKAAIPTLNARPISEAQAANYDPTKANEEPGPQPELKGAQRRASKQPRRR